MKTNRKLFAFGLLIFLSVNLYSQQVISSAGTTVKNATLELSWTVGEPVIETFTGTSNILTQGFHQTRLVVTTVDPVEFPGLSLIVYPNPVSSTLRLEIKGEMTNNISYCLFDFNGKLMLNKQVENLPELINMEIYAPGAYLLKVFRETDLPLRTFKIVKN